MTVYILFRHLFTIPNRILGIANIFETVLSRMDSEQIALVIITISTMVYLFIEKSVMAKMVVFFTTVLLVASFQRKLANPS